MKGREPMETTDNVAEIDFVLRIENSKEILSCDLDKINYSIDFTSKDQSKLREFFLAVLNKERNGKFHFKYVKDSSFSNLMIEKVASEYVTALNNEIDSIYIQIVDEIEKESALKKAETIK